MTNDIHEHRHEQPKKDVKVPIYLGKFIHVKLLVHQPDNDCQTNKNRRYDPTQTYGIQYRRILKIILDFIHFLKRI